MLKSLRFRFQSRKPISRCAHLHAINLPPNQLLAQVLADDNLDAALNWLKDNSREQDHSDVWDVSRAWAQRKADLQQRVRSGEFSFQTVREVEIQNADGQTELREIRCAEDRVLIRAIAQALQPVLADNIAPECVHLAGRGGTQQAVEAVHTHLKANPNSFVMKSDITGYYAHIDHVILHEQFCTLLPQETVLQRVLWQFMQRTVEQGGNYRDIERGIPLGASLSPLLGALYLSPLDALFTGDEARGYKRYMDDWVIFCKNRWDLRKVVKQVYAVLQALHVGVALDKTYLGKASKGFDFLGKRILPIGVFPSQAALSRMQKNTVRLYEQGASKKRIWKYWVRWLGWAGLFPVAVWATGVGDAGGDNGVGHAAGLACRGGKPACVSGSFDAGLATGDNGGGLGYYPILVVLPDDDPSGATYPASAYSNAKSSVAPSVPPDVTCSSPDNGNPTQGTYRTTITLGDGESCAITVRPQANGDPYADVVYTGTLSRTGNVYYLTNGEVCGGPYTACAPPPPVSGNVNLTVPDSPTLYRRPVE